MDSNPTYPAIDLRVGDRVSRLARFAANCGQSAESDPESLLSFAAVTDDPPFEIAAAGHDRCIIPIKPANVDAWLNPQVANLCAQYAILDDRERPFYEHQLAA